ncbi:MAG: HNH endonuclease [Bdellovibrionales bacterium]|nr:HNH endonuclease [Bdellovibrionales bacterium]
MRSLFSNILVAAIIFNFQVFAAASFSGGAPENNQSYNHYYFFTNKTVSKNQFNPAAFASESLKAVVVAITDTMNLLVWQDIKQPLPTASEPYNRRKHFGTWIVDGRNGNCLNTRAEVLVRDSSDRVTMLPSNHCIVATGRWADPYGGRVFTSSKDIQIDHMVPLKHAYIAGGWKWNSKLRCLYANYTGYKGHLVSSAGPENQSKGDGTPYSYLPPNKAYVCTYLAEWLKIKLIWNLALIPPEVQAIANTYKKYHCSSNQFEVSLAELRAQRKWMLENRNLCDYDTAPSYYDQSQQQQQAVGQ